MVTYVYRPTRAAPPCPCNVFSSSQPSTVPGLFTQPGTIELGFKFRADQNGYISGIRFYKVTGMTGTHTASLWDQYGTRIAQATFTSESPTGWQEVDFSPVAVTANTIYTASVFMADGNYPATSNYFTADISNSPLIVPRNGTAYDSGGKSGQGVFDDTQGSNYPAKTFGATNYWIDVSYVSSTTATPIISAQTPAPNATNVAVTDAVTATFNGSLDQTTVGANSIVLKDDNSNIIPGLTSYNSATYTVKFIPTSLLKTSTTYTATMTSSNLGVTDLQGHHLAVDNVWSFTTSSSGLTCPCTMKDRQSPSGSFSGRDSYPSGLELGLKVIPTTNGYIKALRFYKTIITPDTSHIGHIWDANGNMLASVTFNNETNYGWQEATLSSPLSVTKDQLYIISYGMTTSYYQLSSGVFTAPMVSQGLVAYPSGDIRNTAVGSGTGNSVYAASSNTYPTQSSTNDYYVDAVFSTQATDTIPLHVVGVQPTDKSYGVLHTTNVSATFDQSLDSSTVTSSTVKVYDSNNNQVSGTVAYDSTKQAITFTPASAYNYNSTYSVHISSQVKDTRGLNLPSDYTWSFTVGSPLKTDINQGNGGPILVVTTAANPYSGYYTEILKTEGFTYFDVKDISTVSAQVLQNYKVVILANMSVSQSQVDMFSSWVNGGGNLITMRPDKKFASLLGINDIGQTSTNQYLRTNVASAAGIGIVDTTIQYKGVADDYSLNGAGLVATLYSDSSTSTPYPAATSRSVGEGTAMSFTYDLARSVIGLHQGNQAWAGQDRNGDVTIRSNDLFYGPAAGDVQPDWLDSSKMDIPQADEQQRLLANMITAGMKKTMPAPRFWYLPDSQKAALVLAGDDHNLHNNTGTEQEINNWLNDSTTGCSVIDWGCVRASHYVYYSDELTPTRAYQYESYGFDIGNHPSNGNTCINFLTFGAVAAKYASELSTWQTQYPNLPAQKTVRFHCYLWSNWDWMPQADLLNNIHYDLNTVAYPASWIGTHSPIVTGSGMNMRLTDTTGALLDVHQGVTNFDNTTASSTSIAAAFDNALGSDGYYGIFGSHYDMGDIYDKTLYSVATSRNIPIISSQQALEWLSGRESSNFSQISSTTPGKETFTISAGEGAHGLQAMMPINDEHGTLTNIIIGTQAVTYRTDVIKGVEYAIFNAIPGDYAITYNDFGPTPSITAVSSTIKKTNSGAGNVVAVDQTSDTAQTTVPPDTKSTSQHSPSAIGKTDAPDKNTIGAILQTILIVSAAVAVIGGGCAAWFFVIRPRP